MKLSPLAGEPAPAALLVNVAKLVMTCYTNRQIIKCCTSNLNSLYPK